MTMPVTPKEFEIKMREISILAEEDEEQAHKKADRLMCEVLNSLGYEVGTRIFDSMPKWYA